MAGQGSARVTLKEIDLSQVRNPQQLPQGVPAAVVGTARKGPAFVPRTFANMQQFEEVFGSMRSRGRLMNSNLYAPMALNQWMQNASAGTFLRVLGVGDGTSDATGAGFNVTQRLVHEVSGDTGKVSDNPYAAINDSTKALSLARTHFLGCFMKDTEGSNYLQESGLQASLTSSQITINFDAAPANNDTITLKGLSEAGVLKTFVFTFAPGAGAHTYGNDNAGVIAVTVGGGNTADNAGNRFKQVLEGLNFAGDSAGLDLAVDPATYFSVVQNADTSILVIRQQGAGEGTNTEVTYNITTAFEITAGEVTKQNSLASQTVDSTASGATAASTVIRVSNKPRVVQQAKTTITVAVDGQNLPEDDQSFTVTDEDGNSQVFTFKNGGAAQAELNSPIFIDTNGKNNNSLAEAIHDAIKDAIDSSDGNAVNDVQSALTKLTLTDPAGGADNFTITSDGNINLDIVTGLDGVDNVSEEQTQEGGDADDSFTVTDILGKSSTFTFKDADDTVDHRNNANDYHIGVQTLVRKAHEAADNITLAQAIHDAISNAIDNADDGENSLTNLTLVDPAGGADSFTITSRLNGVIANIVDLDPNNSVAVNGVSDDQTDGSNGTPSSITLTFSGIPTVGDEFTLSLVNTADATTTNETFKFIAPTDNGEANGVADNNGKYQIETPANLAALLTNIRSAIIENFANDYQITIDFDSNSITITNEQVEGFVQDQPFVFSLSENVAVTGTETVTGKFGPQTISFVGGGGAAVPVIRGVLMTPQGVRLTLKPNADLTNLSEATPSESNIRAEAEDKTFGNNNDASSDLAGYVIGEVTGTEDSFTLYLNGFTNLQYPATIDCSFNPDSDSYISKVLNTDPTKIEELGHYLYAWWDITPNVAEITTAGLTRSGSNLAGFYEDMAAFLVKGNKAATGIDYEDFSSRYQTAKTPWLTSQSFGGKNYKLFRLHVLDDGEIGNQMYRLQVSNIRYVSDTEYGYFDLALERFDSKPVSGDVVYGWKGLTLDPSNRNYIGRVIGDQHTYYDFDKPESRQRLVSEGTYNIRNDYVRVELSDDLISGSVPTDSLPVGFMAHRVLNTAVSNNFLEESADDQHKVFLDSNGDPEDVLSAAKVAPIKFVRSLSRVVTGSQNEVLDDLSWGVKFAKKIYPDSLLKENVELEFDKSIKSYTKYFPHFSNVTLEDDGSASFKHDRFSLENIQIPSSGLATDDSISTWDDAVYRRDGVLNGNGRFVKIGQDAKGKNIRYLKFRCLFQGGFDGVNIFDNEKANLTGTASIRENYDETDSNVFTGPTIAAYQKACSVLTDKSATEFQLLAIPGQRAPGITDFAMSSCEDRFDALYIMDIVEKDASGAVIEDELVKPHVRNTIAEFSNRNLNSSFGAAYFPNVMSRRPSDGALIAVPPSVGVLGAISRNDTLSAPWFAPAGLNRGRINAGSVRVQMNRDLLDELYDADINPIYEPAGRSGEVYIFGQKTLLQDESALDRINVRRLLIDIRRKVKRIGESLLFEPNRASTLARFSSLVEPIMKDVQKRQGVSRYKVQIDSSTTTQNDIENNTIRGKIYLQPLKSIEFISLDFIVTNTIE